MPTLHSTPSAPARTHGASAILLAAISALVAVSVAALFIAFAVPRTTTPAAQHPFAYFPLIQYRGTGAPPPTARAPIRTAYIRAEHSYGAVP
jgi:hypothetical protein